MAMLAGRIDAVIGVDTHKASHTAAVVTPTGGATAHLTVPSDAVGAKRSDAPAVDAGERIDVAGGDEARPDHGRLDRAEPLANPARERSWGNTKCVHCGCR